MSQVSTPSVVSALRYPDFPGEKLGRAKERDNCFTGSPGAMVGPSGRQAADANCTVKLPATCLPKDKVKVLLLENINQTAIEIFKAEGFQLVSIRLHPFPHLLCRNYTWRCCCVAFSLSEQC